MLQRQDKKTQDLFNSAKFSLLLKQKKAVVNNSVA